MMDFWILGFDRYFCAGLLATGISPAAQAQPRHVVLLSPGEAFIEEPVSGVKGIRVKTDFHTEMARRAKPIG